MDRLSSSLISCLDGFGCMNIFHTWLPGAVGEQVVLDGRRFAVLKLVRAPLALQSVHAFQARFD